MRQRIRCNSAVADGDMFCVVCGTKQSSGHEVIRKLQNNSRTIDKVKESEVAKSSYMWPLIIFAAIMLIGPLVYVLTLQYINKREKSTPIIENSITTKSDSIDKYTDASTLNSYGCEEFLYTLYKDYVFGASDFNKIAPKILSQEVSQFLQDNYGYILEEGEIGYAVWMFRTGYQDGPNDVRVFERFIHLGGGWVRVYYTDMGHDGVTDLKLEIHNGAIRIADMRSEQVDYHKRLMNK